MVALVVVTPYGTFLASLLHTLNVISSCKTWQDAPLPVESMHCIRMPPSITIQTCKLTALSLLEPFLCHNIDSIFIAFRFSLYATEVNGKKVRKGIHDGGQQH